MSPSPRLNVSLKVNKEYQALVTPLSDDEYRSLKQSIKDNGYWEANPIVINRKGIILDGHHCYKICKELGISPTTKTMHFQDELQEKLYVIDCNLIRRQLNKFQKTELALKLKPILQKIAKRNSRANLKQNRKGSPSVLIGTVGTGNGDGIGIGRVDQEIGNRAGVGKNTVWRVEKLLGLESAHPELLAGLRSGKLSINKASNNVEKEERRQKIIDEAANYSFSKGDNSNEKCQLFRSDFRDLTPKKIVDNSIDLIFTDPPYEKSI